MKAAEPSPPKEEWGGGAEQKSSYLKDTF